MNAEEIKAKQQKFHRRIICEAVGIVVLFHLILLGLFRYAPRIAEAAGAERKPVMMLNLAALPEEERQFWDNWLTYHDPSLISRPDRKYTYSAVRQEAAFREALPGHAAKLPLAEPEPRPAIGFGRLPQLPSVPSVPARLAGYRAATVALLQPPPAVKASLPRFSLNGRPWNLPVPPETFEESAAGGSYSVIRFYPARAAGMLRYEVSESNGAPAQEQLAIRLLLQQPELAGADENQEVRIQWREE